MTPNPNQASSMSVEELLPCPFCGHDAVEADCFSRDKDGVCDEPAVTCNGCGVIVVFDFKALQPWQEIRTRWNACSEAIQTKDER